MATEEGWGDIAEVAAYLQVTKESIYRWVDSKGFPARRVGRLLRFKLSQVDEWVEKAEMILKAAYPARRLRTRMTNKNG